MSRRALCSSRSRAHEDDHGYVCKENVSNEASHLWRRGRTGRSFVIFVVPRSRSRRDERRSTLVVRRTIFVARGHAPSLNSMSRMRATTPSPPLAGRQGRFLKRDIVSGRRRKSNAVHPICSSTPDRVLSPSPLTADNAATTRLDWKSEDPKQSARSYLITVQILHGLDLVNPCSSRATRHAFLPIATIAISSTQLDVDHRYTCSATQHAQNHSLWRPNESSLNVEICLRSTAMDGRSQHEGAPSFSMRLSVSGKCKHHKSITESELQYIGETEEVWFLLTPDSYEVVQFLTVWRRLGSNSALGPFEAGKVKLRVKVEAKRASTPTESSHGGAVSTPEQQGGQQPHIQQLPERPSFLPSNFADALAAKRKQLRATVAPEDARDRQNDGAQRLRESQEHDKANSERILKEIEEDPTLTRFSANQVEILNQTGEGVHSSVLHGRLVGVASSSIDSSFSHVDVAVKEFRYQQSFPPPKVLDTFRREYQLLEKCSREGASYIVNYLGVRLTPRPAILTEFFPNGSLAHCMQNPASWRQVCLLKKAHIALQVAEALNWLHVHDIIHRDVKRHNILLDLTNNDRPLAKICDVGNAVIWRSNDRLLTDEVGSSGYSAPEIFTGEGYANKVDVWSFGIVLWELLQQQSNRSSEKKDGSTTETQTDNPFAGLANDVFVDLARNGTRPPCAFEDSRCSLLFGNLLQKCWMFEPDARPSMQEVVAQLRMILDNLSTCTKQTWDLVQVKQT